MPDSSAGSVQSARCGPDGIAVRTRLRLCGRCGATVPFYYTLPGGCFDCVAPGAKLSDNALIPDRPQEIAREQRRRSPSLADVMQRHPESAAAVLAEMPGRMREVFLAVAWLGQSQQHVASDQGCSRQAIQQRVDRARQRFIRAGMKIAPVDILRRRARAS